MRVGYALCLGVVAVAVAVAACGGSASSTAGGIGRSAGRSELVAVGEPVHGRVADVLGSAGTLELSAADPTRSGSPLLFATLIRAIAREPRDVCFGVYTGNANPADGDVGCQVRAADPLVSSVGVAAIPGRVQASFATYVLGQAPSDVTRVELFGPGGARTLPLSTHRMFLARFALAARGPARLVATFADGHRFTRSFNLPLSRGRASDRNPRYRRPGAVFNDEVGENIIGQSFRGIVTRFGAPLRSFSGKGGARCAYYDVVGYPTGWVFCFKHGLMTGAAGNQTPPAGVH